MRQLILFAALLVGLVARAVDETEALAVPADSFTGLSIALNATELTAPESGFSIGGWRSWGGDAKLAELAKDGLEVKKGDVVARFEFDGAEALAWVQQNLQRVQADQSQARIRLEQKVEGLQVDQRAKALEADLAAIDIKKERAISKRQVALYKIAHRLAEFEEGAVGQRLGSAIRTRDAEMAFHDLTVKRHEQNRDRYDFYVERYQVRAPHDGVLRHAYNPRERRKFQKGDSVRAGTKLVAIARDAQLGVRFFVPEHRIHELAVGTKLIVVSPSSGEELPAIVKQVDFFPQELGFLMELPTLPNAREKAFAVVAEFQRAPRDMTAGTELRVKVSSR